MDRCWFLTWTTYGTWLPGDSRGFVSNVGDETGAGVRHNQPRTEYDADQPGLRRYMMDRLKGPPIYLGHEYAQLVLRQIQETALHRRWLLLGAAIMANHLHVVVAVPNDPDPEVLLRDFKSYASRKLNRQWGKPPSATWWTESGSTRKLPDENAAREVVCYVTERQERPLVVWRMDGLESWLAAGGRVPLTTQ